jgi:hypothetical protein
MRRSLAALAATTTLALLPAAAGAKVIEIGQTTNPFMPSCPAAPCFAVSRTTGYQAKVGTSRGLMTVPAPGRIVAWTISLSQPSPAQISFFDKKLGGPSQAGISILKVGKHLHDTVSLAGPLTLLEPYFGGTVQFPLVNTLPVKKGDLIALTVPSWAPALQVNLANDTSWRASRLKGTCKDNTTQTAQLQAGAKTQYYCLYRGARLTYSATLITRPVQTNTPKKPKTGAKNG